MPEQRLLKLTSPMMRGDDVKDLQQWLKQLGYEITDVDGFFGSEADKAVRAFQKDAGLGADGIVGSNTYKAPDEAEAKPEPKPQPPVEAEPEPEAETIPSPSVETPRSVAEPTPRPAASAISSIGQQPTRDSLIDAIGYVGLNLRRNMEQTDEVREASRDLQRHLRALGYLRAGIDGALGSGTEHAIRALQYDLLQNDGTDAYRGEAAPVRVMDYNQGRVTEVTGVADEGTVACIRDILADDNFPLLPMSEDARAANRQIQTRISELTSDQVPIPFLMAIIEQESNFRHFSVPSGRNEDSYIIVGLDRNDKNAPERITSRGYGVKQYTLFHHPPRQEEVEQFMLNVEGNLQKGITLLREKLDRFVNGPADTADDRIAEFGNGDLRLCKYAEDDARYLNDCVVCMQEAASITIEAGTTPFYEGSSGVFNPTQYHRETRLEDVPVRAAVGCDWPYGARRYNGSGVNSFWYQAEILLKVKALNGE